MVLHHADTNSWDANQGKWVNSSSTVGSAAAGSSATPSPVGFGVTDVTGAQVYSTLFPGTTLREDGSGRIGLVIAVTSYPTGSTLGEENPGLCCTLLFGRGQPDEQVGTLLSTARYPAEAGVGLLAMSASADGTRAASIRVGTLADGTSFSTTHAFTTLLSSSAALQNIFGPELFYSASGTSNLVASIAAVAGTDAFGTAYRRGIGVYNSALGTTIQLDPNTPSINLGLPASNVTLAQLLSTVAGQLVLLTGKNSGGDTTGQLSMLSVNNSPVSNSRAALYGSDLYSLDEILNNTTAVSGWNPVTGSMSAPGFKNSWSNSGSGPHAQYRRVSSPPNSIEIIGDVQAGTTADGTALWTMPTGYRPANVQTAACPLRVPGTAGNTIGNAWLLVATTGDVECEGISSLTSGARIAFHGFVSLDA